jgi:hypothetical protein
VPVVFVRNELPGQGTIEIHFIFLLLEEKGRGQGEESPLLARF